ncbi:MAG: AAA family ATPase [Spirulina sp. SIO3F2]|nr:AAA family ATPase [Spirulina sp. SIO3F2]
MGLDLTRFYQVCNPSKTLDASNPDDQQYYIDFAAVRGDNLINELERTITRLSPHKPTCQLFTGHIGCGKSTELLQLKHHLTHQKFHVIYFESSADLDMADVDVTDILLAIARQVSESLESLNIRLKPNYFVELVQELGEILQTPIEITGVDFSVGIANITASTKGSPKLRNRLRQHLEPRTTGILEAINQELLAPAIAALKAQGYEGLVVIIDNLDRIDNVIRTGDRSQPTYLFVDRGEQLTKLNCHVVYTMPLVLAFSNDLARITNRFGVEPKVLPMVSVRLPDGNTCMAGMTLLRQMILARAFPELAAEQRLGNVHQVFDTLATLERLCAMSGGHVRNLLGLLYHCLQRRDPPITADCLEQIIRQRRDALLRAITPEEMALLRQVQQKKNVRGETAYQTLLRSMFVYEYSHNEWGSWCDLNPILNGAPELEV